MDEFVSVKPRDDGNWTIVLSRGVELPIENGEMDQLANILYLMGFGDM